MSKSLLIKLQNIEIKNKSRYQYAYYSFSINEVMYFSSCFDEQSSILSDDILIPLQDSLPAAVDLHRWENHMIMFTYSIDITELKSRKSTKKKYETKSGQILSLSFLLLNSDQLVYSHKFISSISQHYLIISNLRIESEKKQKKSQGGPSFFVVKTSHNDYALPITDGELCIKLPQKLEFQHIKSSILMGTSESMKSEELTTSSPIIPLQVKGKKKNDVTMDLKWVTNIQQAKPENNLLMETHEIIIYDMEVKFENNNEFGNAKVKFAYGNKGFQIGSEFNTSKAVKIKKIIFLVIKSQEEEISIIVEKNMKAVSKNSFYTGDVEPYTVHTCKKKLMDSNGKSIGYIRFRAEKAKNLSTPQNNKFWRQNTKKKTLNSATLSIQQVSVNYQRDDDISVIVKTESEEWIIPDVPNFQVFNPYKQISSEGVVVNAKYEESIYMMVKQGDTPDKKQINQGDFIGIAIINPAELKMGLNSIEVPCFKNQEKTVIINCLINKVIPYPFIKATFQPEHIGYRNHKTIGVRVGILKTKFTPYYYTFRYDKKNQVYCIVQINGIKKVLIMENSIDNQLVLVPSAGSDNLNFAIESSDFLKLKIVCMISDIGQEQQIYGSLLLKMKTEDLNKNPFLQFQKVELKNQFETAVGIFDIEVSKREQQSDQLTTQKSSLRGEFKRGKKTVESRESRDYSNPNRHKSINPIRNSQNQSLDLKGMLNKSTKHDKNYLYESPHHQENVKLPVIKQSKKSSLKDLVHLMKVRKRGLKGYDETNTVQSYHKPPYSDRRSKKETGLYKIEKENPNLQKNLEILFPKKPEYRYKQEKKKDRKNQYDDQLKGLKSVYQQISRDMGEIEPSYKDSKESREQRNVDFHGMEWEGNEFADPQDMNM